MFKLDTRKAIEASATLLRHVQHKLMGRKRLLALLYLADRECLKRTGRPIIGGKLVAMKYGPIHSEVYDLIKGGHKDQPQWSSHFENETYNIVLCDELSISALSRYEIDLLDEISKKYSGYDDWDVADVTHEFDEYKATYLPETSTCISLDSIIDSVGRTKDKEAINQDSIQKTYFDQFFADDK